ncbi:hypothetical protein H3S80_07630 [Bartonella sp. M0177]|uniref:hypothetical protein n=1 Tax=Bartonella sp. M0177 TaxID=2750940 RepID=UPI0018DDF4FF|nr:hypothetical protein [Bartonella sp. M0177]MBI0003917.1 hypothetical protein [Bartonella sp. M0177]
MKIDQRGLTTSRILKTLKAFSFQNNFGERVFLKQNFIEIFFQKAVFESELPQSCRYAIFLELERLLFNERTLLCLKPLFIQADIHKNSSPQKKSFLRFANHCNLLFF